MPLAALPEVAGRGTVVAIRQLGRARLHHARVRTAHGFTPGLAVVLVGEDPAALISNDRAISDSRFVVNYYRLSADGRLVFGGGERYTTDAPSNMAEFVRQFMERTFPQLRGEDFQPWVNAELATSVS